MPTDADFNTMESNLAGMLQQPPPQNAPAATPPVGGAAYDALLNSPAAQQEKQVVQQKQQEMQPVMDKFSATAGQPLPKPPAQEKIQPSPEQKQFGVDAENYVMAMTALSAITGAFSKQHAKTALTAFSAGIDGYMKGNQQAFENATKKWKNDTDAALENNRILTEQYKQVIDNRALTESEQLQQLKMISMKYQDPLMLAADNMGIASSIVTAQVKANQKATEEAGKIQETVDKLNKINEAKEKLHDEKIEKARNDPGFNLAVKTFHETGDLNKAVGGWGSQEDKEIVRTLTEEKYPDFDQANVALEYAGKMQAERSLATMTTKINLASNILDKSIPSLIGIAQKYQLSALTDLNTVWNFVNAHGSSQDKANFSTQLRAVTTDYAQFLGRGRQTVHSDEEALKILHDNMGVSSLQGFQQAVSVETQNVKAGIAQTQQELTGGKTGGAASSDAPVTENGGWSIEPVK